MSRPFQIGDFVLVRFGDSASYYRAAIVTNEEISVSPTNHLPALAGRGGVALREMCLRNFCAVTLLLLLPVLL